MGNAASSPALWSIYLKPNWFIFRSLANKFLRCHCLYLKPNDFTTQSTLLLEYPKLDLNLNIYTGW